MNKKLTVLSLAALLSAGVAHAATKPENAKFNGVCAQALATEGKMVKTDCSVSWTNPDNHETYCFHNQAMKEAWLKNPEKQSTLAQTNFTQKMGSHQGHDGHQEKGHGEQMKKQHEGSHDGHSH